MPFWRGRLRMPFAFATLRMPFAFATRPYCRARICRARSEGGWGSRPEAT